MYEKMYMIYLDRHRLYLPFVLSRNPQEDLPGIFRDFACHDLLSILRDPYNVVLNIIDSVFRSSYWAHTPILYLFSFSRPHLSAFILAASYQVFCGVRINPIDLFSTRRLRLQYASHLHGGYRGPNRGFHMPGAQQSRRR